MHYAVVIENDNPSSNGTVTVVPLKSADSKEEALRELHEKQRFIWDRELL